MEATLKLLRQQGLTTWCDENIHPGEPLSSSIKDKMNEADIFVFLMSQNFIASDACQAEWNYAEQLSHKNKSIVLIPIIIATCPWKDFGRMIQLKALPKDGKPIKRFSDESLAWDQVYDGLKLVIQKLRSTFSIKPEFRKTMQSTEFLSQDHIPLQKIFVFPKLSSYSTRVDDETEIVIKNESELLKLDHAIIYGDRLSGKTALCRYLFLDLVEKQRPVVYVDLENIAKRRKTETIMQESYSQQFSGDFSIWKTQTDKLVILDNLTNDPRIFEHVLTLVAEYERVLITVSKDIFLAFYRDKKELACFRQVELCPLTHVTQESLIRKRLRQSSYASFSRERQDLPLSDGFVDSVEHRINSIIIHNRILPRYPFYVLSILQTYEGYMPNELAVTSYGHCYYVLILAHLQRSGISGADGQIDACFNFAEGLAFEIYKSKSANHRLESAQFDAFILEYRLKFVLPESTLNRVCDSNYGIIVRKNGAFRFSYMYYYFLGKYLARHTKETETILDDMIKHSYTSQNSFVLIFTIHHTTDTDLIDSILLQTMYALDCVKPSRLDDQESKIFEDMVSEIPSDILSPDSVHLERQKERNVRDLQEAQVEDPENDVVAESHELVNEIYRIMKNNEILGQILHNKYGSMKRDKIAEIIETIAEGGLRLIKMVIGDENELHDAAKYLHEKFPDLNPDKLRSFVRLLAFLWTVMNLEKVVSALNKPELWKSVDETLMSKNLPSYDLIRYFLRLDTIGQFSQSDRQALRDLWDKHRFPFFQRVVSLRTQHYLNTHSVETAIEQSVCSILGVKYKPRPKQLDTGPDSGRNKKSRRQKSSRQKRKSRKG